MIDRTLDHLAALVGFDTRNPPRAIGTDGIFAYLRDALPGFTHTTTDHHHTLSNIDYHHWLILLAHFELSCECGEEKK